jgi:hypothetical protein
MIDFSGPAFAYVDNRLMSLQLVKNGMTDAVIFNSQGIICFRQMFCTRKIFLQ